MKNRKAAVILLSAVLAMGTATVSASAAEGWQQSGSGWGYVDAGGNWASNEWKKGADNLWRYLDYKGTMTVNSWVDDEYYVDSNGIMVADKWMKLPLKNPDWGQENTMVWYYFGSTGRIMTDGWAKIAGKYYYFDSDGVMQTGWVDDDNYYMGDDGSMRIGWMYLKDPDADDDADQPLVPYETKDDTHWYYFTSTGKKYIPRITEGDYKLYKIDGVYYCFDGSGKMQTGWVNFNDHDGSFESYRYFLPNGHLQTGWYSVAPPENADFESNGEVEWYYFSANGIPRVGPAIEDASTDDLTRINGITYLFNEKGNPVYGLRSLRMGDTGEDACYFFGANKSVSSVVKGKGIVEEGDGTKAQYYFSEGGSRAGRGYTGVHDNYLYYKGKLQQADSALRYEAIEVGDRIYLVNTAGKIVKSGTVRDTNGTKYKTTSSGQISQIDGVNDRGTEAAREPVEPYYWD